MKKGLFLALLSLAGFQYSFCQRVDTIVGRCPGYYYYGWYDECPRYETDSNEFALEGYAQLAHESVVNNRVVLLEQYSPVPIGLKGVAVMVSMDPGQEPVAGRNMPPADSLRCPEYVYLFRGDSAVSGLPHPYAPRYMTLLDSVRWDTASPQVMVLPRSAAADSSDTAQWLYCYVYEAMFDTVVTVEDTFYLSGTFRNNVLAYTYDTIYDEYGNIDRVRSESRFQHYPTDYVVVRDFFSDNCEKCPTVGRLFFSTQGGSVEWLMAYNWNWFMSGPFLPIVETVGVGRSD